MNEALQQALGNGGGVLSLHANRSLERMIRRAVRKRQLIRVLPHAYAAAGTERGFAVRARAVRVSDPDAVVTGRAAAHLSDWAEYPEPELVTAASRRLRPTAGFCFQDRSVPRSLTRSIGLIRVTSRALTVLDLLPDGGGAVIDAALRRRISLASLRRALDLTPGRPGNELRRRLLDESRDEAWSAAERAAHAALHQAGIGGWVANHPIGLDAETTVYLDIAFRSLRLAVEIDGREHHEGWAKTVRAYGRDRRLAALGWVVVRFSAADVLGDPKGFAAELAAIVAARVTQL